MMAVAIVATVPILALFVLAQKYFVEGITAGAVKE
jgi:ABC-type glycerol-3-phosphate transport system permease component